MKIFLASSFSHQTDTDTGEVHPAYKSFVQYTLDRLREEVGSTFCALEYEHWKTGDQPPELGLVHDLEEIDACEIVIALVTDRPSAGVQFELGYAVAKGKQVIMARQNNDALSWFNQGTVGAGLVTLVSFDNVAKLVDQLIVAITSPP